MLVGKQNSRITYRISPHQNKFGAGRAHITVLLIGCFALGAIIYSIVTPAFAQIPDFGVSNLNGLTPLKGGDLRDIIFKIIQYLMGFLALIVFLLILYAGWMWMTSGGDPGKIKKAKGIIANAVIGLAVIIFSYTITLFVFKIIRDITDGGGGTPPGGTCTPAACQGCFRCNADGLGSTWDQTCSASCGTLPGGGFQLKSVETANGGNTQNDVFACSNLEGVFNNYVNAATLSSETRIVDLTSGSDVSGTWSASANTIHFEHASGGKFIKGTAANPRQYQARFSKSLTDTTGLFLTSCSLNAGCTVESTYLAWSFGVGANDDTMKPTVASAYPEFDAADGAYPDRDVPPTASLEVTFNESVSATSFLVPPARAPGSPECQVVPAPPDCFAHPRPGVIFVEAMNPPQQDPSSPACQVTPKPAGCLPSGSGTAVDPNLFSIESRGKGFRISFIRPNAFQPFSWYRITVVGVKDLCGNTMDVPVSWVWQTNGQTPSITGYPTTGKVCSDSKVFITFGTPMADSRVSLSLLGSDASSFQIALDAAATTGVTSVANADGTLRILDAKTPIDNGYRQFEFVPARNFGESVTYNVSVSTDYVVASDGSTLAKTWQFTTATTADCECSPFIQRINPARGPAGMCVTLSGYCFTGTQSAPATPGDLVFGTTPAAIESVSAGYLVTTVPQVIPFGTRTRPNFTLSYPTSNVDTNNQSVEYFIDEPGAATGPCLVSLSPSRGGVDTSVTAKGKRFGSFDQSTSRMIFSPNIESPVSSAAWSDVQIQTRVPSGAVRGDVVVQNSSGTSNGIEFIVLSGEGQACSQTPDVCSPDPSVCDSSQGLVCSPTCSCVRQSGGGGTTGLRVVSRSPICDAACTNSVVVVRLSKPLLVSSVSNASMRVVSCLTPACNSFGSDIPVSVAYQEDLGAGVFEIVGTPTASLPVNTSFRVIVTSSITSTDNETLGGLNYDQNSDSALDSYSWVFGTKSTQCALASVELRPQTATLERIGATQSWSTSAAGSNQQCSGGVNYINPNTLSWTWSNSSDAVASLTPNASRATSRSVAIGSTVVRAESNGMFDESMLEVMPQTCNTDTQCQNPGNGISCPGSSCDPATKRCLPTITAFSPATAAVGDFVTLNGCYFGTTQGVVTFSNNIVASLPDPAQCGVSWSDRQVVVEVPRLETPTNDPSNDAVTGPVSLKTSSGQIAATAAPFVVGAQSVPGICRVNPPFGRTGERVSVVGRGFGPSVDNPPVDRVFFSPNHTDASSNITRWSETSIDVGVPQFAQTGPIEVLNNNVLSNGYHFTVRSGGVGSGCGTKIPDPQNPGSEICSPNQACAPGLWCETTSVNACTCQNAPAVAVTSISPQGANQCRNIQVSVMFNQLMDTKTLTRDSVQLWVGTPAPRARPDLIPETITSGSACSGSSIALTGTIRNAGAANASSYGARLLLGTSSCTVSSLSTNAGAVSSPITCSVTPSAPGSFQLALEADPNSSLNESDETNNTMLGSVVEVSGPPTAPSGLVVQNVSDTSNQLTWSDSSWETGYSLYRGITQSFSAAVKVTDLAANVTSYTDPGLACGQTYYYWLESKNACGRLRTQTSVSGQTPTCSDFSVQLSQSSLTLPSGSAGSSTLTASSVNGKSTSVTFSLSDCPAGATCSISPAGACSVTPASPCEKTINVSSGTAAPGNYQLVIRGESQTGTSEQITLQVTVGNPVDTTPPSCGATSYNPPLSNWTRGPVTVMVACSDSGTGCAQPTSSTQVSSNGSGTIPISDRANPPNTTQCPYSVTNIDAANPVVASASATPAGFTMEDTAMGDTVTIQTGYPTARWNTTDAGSGIARVELWRADYSSVCNETSKAGCLWASRWSDGQAVNANGRDDSAPIQTLGGNYWYGIHVVDRAGNCVLENNQACQGGVGDPVRVVMNVLQPDFILISVPTTRSMKQNSTISYSITATSIGGFSSPVSFSVSGVGFSLPSVGLSATFSQTSCSPTCVVDLDVTTSQTAQLGTYTLLVQGTSGSLVHSIPVTLTVSLNDIVAPTVEISGIPVAWQKENAALTATCSDSGDGCDPASLQLYLSPTTIVSCPGVVLTDYLSSPQPALSHGWACATALDLAGNRGFSSPIEVKIDQVAPTAVSFEGTPGACGTINWSVVGAADSGGSQLHSQAFSFDNGVFWQTQPTFVESKPSGGPSTRTAQIRDNAGNVWTSGPVTATAVECDVTPPVLSFDSQSRPWGNTDVLVTITASDPSGVATTRHCVTASAVCDPGTTPDTDTFTSGVAILESRNGSWTFCARAKDTIGNWSQSPVCTSGSFQIDKTAPVIQSFNVEGASFGQPRPTNSDGSIDIAWSVSDSGGSGLEGVEIWRAPDNAGVPGDWGTAPVFTSQNASGTWVDTRTNGTYWYGIHAVDNVTPDANCIAGDTSGVSQGHCGGVTSDSEDTNRQKRDPVGVTVDIPVGSFTLSLSPANRVVAKGIPVTYSIEVVPVNGFTSAVGSWVVNNCPGGSGNCTVTPAQCSSGSFATCATLTVQTSSLSLTTYSALSVTGSGGGFTRQSGNASLTVIDPWWDVAWTKRKPLTAANTESAALNRFPVLLRLTSSVIDYAHVGPTGYDLRFIAPDGLTELNFEIERWSPGGESLVWVEIPTLPASPSTYSFWMYYGNTGAPAPAAAKQRGTWNGIYSAVWHLKETSGQHVDSTGNGNSSSVVSVSAQGTATGQIDGADSFNANLTHRVEFPQTSSTALGTNDSMSVSAWVRTTSNPSSWAFLVNKKDDAWQLMMNAQGMAEFWLNGNQLVVKSTAPVINDGSWHMITGTWNSSTGTARLYVDGVERTSGGGVSIMFTPSGRPVVLGEEGDDNRGFNFTGNIDEVRFTKSVLSSAWIAAEYKSATNPSFITFGNEQVSLVENSSSLFARRLAAMTTFDHGRWQFVRNVWETIIRAAGTVVSRAFAQPAQGTLVSTSFSFAKVPSGTSGCTHVDGCTVVYLRPAQALAANTAHSLYVASGVKSAYGVMLTSDDIRLNQFTTGNELCSLTGVQLVPSNMVLTERGEEQAIVAQAKSGAVNVVGIPSVYDWSYSWSNGGASSFTLTPLNPPTSATIRAAQNGGGTVSATLTVTSDTINTPSSTGRNVTGSALVDVFLCENPWIYENTDHHMLMKYCMDGEPSLPSFSNPPNQNTNLLVFPSGDRMLFDGLFLRGGDSPDAIGLRIYSNLDHLDMRAWYEANITNRGNPSSVTVDGFSGLRDGRSIYVSAVNTQGTGFGQRTYTNIYILSYNEGADSVTQTVFDQIVKNIKFMINIQDPVIRDQFRRDALRITTLGTIINAVAKNRSCPELTGGTFVSGRSTSAWSSWRSQLVSELGIKTLAADPINSFANCPTGYDPATCWNSSTRDFVCPSGSHVMQYFRDGNDCRVSVNMELKRVQWEGNPPLSGVTSAFDTCDSTISWPLLANS